MEDAVLVAVVVVSAFIGTLTLGFFLVWLYRKRVNREVQPYYNNDGKSKETVLLEGNARMVLLEPDMIRVPYIPRQPSITTAPLPTHNLSQSSNPDEPLESDDYDDMTRQLYQNTASIHQARAVQFVPVDHAMILNQETLFVEIPTAYGVRYAEVDPHSAVTSGQQLFRCLLSESPSKNQLSAMSNQNQQDVYGNAEAILKSLTIDVQELRLGEILGTGAFGDVLLATWSPKPQQVGIKVAVKRVKWQSTPDEASTRSFLAEMTTIAQLTHENIVHLLAVTTEPPLIVLEYVSGGSVQHWFKSITRAPPIQFSLVMAQQVARGLKYLASRNVVHRDVATRNVLIRFQTEHSFTCKLTDFGLSQIFDKHSASTPFTMPLPVRWTAPEGILFSLFSEKSDVWSYGVMLWELFTGCRQFPYESCVDDMELLTLVTQGLRLPRPERITDEIYQLMSSCWFLEANQRPTFSQIVTSVPKLIQGALSNALLMQLPTPFASQTAASPQQSVYHSLDRSRIRSVSEAYAHLKQPPKSAVSSTYAHLTQPPISMTSNSNRLSVVELGAIGTSAEPRPSEQTPFDSTELPELSSSESQNIEDWRHRIIDRVDCEAYLLEIATSDGQYLIRTSKDGRQYILSIRAGSMVGHFKLTKRGRGVTLKSSRGERVFENLEDFIRFFKVHDSYEIGGMPLATCIALPACLQD